MQPDPQAIAVEDGIAVRLADEGVPLCAIARAVKIPSERLREQLQSAIACGRLVELPRDDWPPGFPRDQRALQLSRMVIENRDAVMLAVQRTFALTPTEVGLLLVMLQHPSLLKDRVADAFAAKTLDVHICRIRARLAPHGIGISTLWGLGYQMQALDRRRAMDLILREVHA
jgi:DNA-binding response OmpR family regulator